MKTAAIVGGGITGLTAAYRLQQAIARQKLDAEVVLLESSGRIGGKILSEKVAGTIFEGGPDSFITLKPQALDLILELGIGPSLLPTNRDQQDVYVYARGKLRKLPEGMFLMAPAKVVPFLRSDLMSWPGKIRMGFDYILPAGKSGGDESMGSFARRRFGGETVETIVQPIMAGIYAGDADALSLKSTFPRFIELEEEYGSVIRGLRAAAGKRPPSPPGITAFMSLSGGLQELAGALESRLDRGVIRTGAQVTNILRETSGYRIEIEGREPLDCAAVVLTAPAWSAAAAVKRMAPGLTEILNEIPFTSAATVSVMYKAGQISAAAKGFGFVVRRDETQTVSAGTFTSIKFPGRVPPDKFLIRCFLGGAGGASAMKTEDGPLLSAVRADLRRLLGIEAEPEVSKIYRWPKANPQYTVGHSARLARIADVVKNLPGLVLAGASYSGVGIPDCIASGTDAALAASKILV